MRIVEKPSLPKEIESAKATPQLLSQAVRVYLSNQRQGTQSVLTRAEVARTRKKIYRQKGTGQARHGDRKAPIYVGGGVAFAPKPRDYSLNLSKKMKKLARLAALKEKAKEKKIIVGQDMSRLSGKTKELAQFLEKLNVPTDRLLIITDTARENIYRAGRNISGVKIAPVNLLSTYEILGADNLLIMEEATKFLAGESSQEKPVQKVTEKRVRSKPMAKPVRNLKEKKVVRKRASKKSK